MDTTSIAARLDGRLVMLGYGCIGQGVLPLLLRHLDCRRDQVTVVSPDSRALRDAALTGVHCQWSGLTPHNWREVLQPLLGAGDLLLDVSVDVDSIALVEWCRERGVLYVDLGLACWPREDVARVPPSLRTCHMRREAALALRRKNPKGPTALVDHGASPGLVSHLLKDALLHLADATGRCTGAPPPATRDDWARLAQALGVRVIHIAERDTQTGEPRKRPGEFVNTWSVRGFVERCGCPAELGWGSHEQRLPADGDRHVAGSRAAIYLRRPGAATWVRSWTPLTGPMHGLLIANAAAVSIAEALTVGDADRPVHRPTVHVAYQPCDDALLSVHELAAREWRMQESQRILKGEITGGHNELGVLLLGHARTGYWFGSQLSSDEARAVAPDNNATSLQAAAAALAGVAWALKHPDRGLLEPDELPHEEILALCRPYLGHVVGVFTDWTPLQGRERLFEEDLDFSDPWQFGNFRVN